MYVISAKVKYFDTDTKICYAVDNQRDGGPGFYWGPIQDIGLLKFNTIKAAEEWFSVYKKELGSTHNIDVREPAITEITTTNVKSLSG